MTKINKTLEQLKQINYILILRYLVYLFLICLFLFSLKGCFGELNGNEPMGTCENAWNIKQNFNLPSGFSVTSFYYFSSIYNKVIIVCKMSLGSAFILGIVFLITYFIFKSITERILPPKHPLLRDSLEILVVLIYYHWQLFGIIYHQNLWSLLPAILLIMFSETFYVWVIMLIRRLAIENGLTNPLKNILYIFCIVFWVVLITRLNIRRQEKQPVEIQLDETYNIVIKEKNKTTNLFRRGRQKETGVNPLSETEK